jgi:hypothetical protein
LPTPNGIAAGGDAESARIEAVDSQGGGGEEETRRGNKTLTLGLLYFSLISEKGLFQNVITKYYSLRSLI